MRQRRKGAGNSAPEERGQKSASVFAAVNPALAFSLRGIHRVAGLYVETAHLDPWGRTLRPRYSRGWQDGPRARPQNRRSTKLSI